MRIPITIKVPVRVAGPADGPSLANIVIRDLSSGFEKISVRLLHRLPPSNKLVRKKPAIGGEIHKSSPTRFPVVFRPNVDIPPAPIVITPRLRYTVRTIHITLAWPTLPGLEELWQKLTRIPKKIWLRVGAVAAAVAIAVICLNLIGGGDSSQTSNHAHAAAGPPKLTRGTPSYNTVLPAGKTIAGLGGWTRISPPGKDPVYTYIDKINKVQINVSEQPLPATFQHNTAAQVAHLAESFNATDKFEVGSTTVYIGSSSDGSQSVILAKANLLILIKSAEPLSNNQWAAYVSALH